MSLLPSPTPNYTLVRPQVPVPSGFLPVKVAQFHETCWATNDTLPNHWAIFVPTSPIPGIGNYYERVGSSPVYLSQSTFRYHHAWAEQQRGSHTVGFIPARLMPNLERRLSLVSAEGMRGCWGSQQWVWEALQVLQTNRDIFMTQTLTQAELCLQMKFVESAWAAGGA